MTPIRPTTVAAWVAATLGILAGLILAGSGDWWRWGAFVGAWFGLRQAWRDARVDEDRAHLIAEALLDAAKDAQTTLRARLDAERTLAANLQEVDPMAEQLATGVYTDDPSTSAQVDLVDALWRVAAEYVAPDDECDVRCAVLAAFALRRGLTPASFADWMDRAIARRARIVE